MVVRKLSKPSRPTPKGSPLDTPGAKRFIPSPNPTPPRSDSPLAILREIEAKRLDPTYLSPDQRRGCLALMVGRHTAPALASLFGVSVDTVRKDIKLIRETLGREARDWSLDEVVGDLVSMAEACSAKAMELQDPGMAWTIKRELVRELKGLGLLGGDTKDGGIRITIEAMGEGIERARDMVARSMDARLTGEVIDTEIVPGAVKGDRFLPPALPAPRTRPGAPTHDPLVEVEFKDVEDPDEGDEALGDLYQDVEPEDSTP